MTTLLVLTTGHTDVQLVVEDQRQELDGKTCGLLHDTLRQRTWQVVDAPSRKKEGRASTLPEGDVKVCTPKLDAVLRYLENALQIEALIFETRRKLSGDPRFAGAVLEQRLKNRGIDRVQRHSFLEGDEWLEDPANDQDAVVRRTIVEGLSNAIADAIAFGNADRVVLATLGGMEPANQVIEELVRLHAVGGPRVISLEVPDGALTGREDRAVAERFHPAAGYRARWHALSLIVKGNLLGAWGAVSHLENEPGQGWTQVVKWLACFASSQPMPEGCDIPVLTHARMAVRAALRVELALRAGDIPRAVHGTVAFFEAALWDRLLEHFERHATDPQLVKVRDGAAAPTGKLLRDGGDDDMNRPFQRKQQPDGRDCFRFYESGAGRFARDYVRSKSLKALLDAVERVKRLRNDVAHNEPTSELMADARRCMTEAGLWSTSDTFLSQDLVREVLEELGEAHPERLCEDLMATTRSRLVAARQQHAAGGVS